MGHREVGSKNSMFIKRSMIKLHSRDIKKMLKEITDERRHFQKGWPGRASGKRWYLN